MQQQTPIPPFPTSIGFFDADFSAADAGAFQRQLPPYAKMCLCSPPARMWSDPRRFLGNVRRAERLLSGTDGQKWPWDAHGPVATRCLLLSGIEKKYDLAITLSA